jgi:hypothetical protein
LSESSLTAAALSPLTTSIPAGTAGSSVQLPLVLKPGSLPRQSTLVFTLTAALPDGTSASASVTLQTNEPPSPGSFSVAPSSGISGTTLFEWIAVGWQDVDLPVLFVHGFLSPQGEFLALQSRSEQSRRKSPLIAPPPPLGSGSSSKYVTCELHIFDAIGAKTTAAATVSVVQTSTSSSSGSDRRRRLGHGLFRQMQLLLQQPQTQTQLVRTMRAQAVDADGVLDSDSTGASRVAAAQATLNLATTALSAAGLDSGAAADSDQLKTALATYTSALNSDVQVLLSDLLCSIMSYIRTVHFPFPVFFSSSFHRFLLFLRSNFTQQPTQCRPAAECAALGREPCGPVALTCGSCIAGRPGEDAPSNAPCLLPGEALPQSQQACAVQADCTALATCQAGNCTLAPKTALPCRFGLQVH